MHNLYLATTFAGALVCLLASILLFSRRKEGKRSRTILAFIILFSVANYIPRFIALSNGEKPDVVVSAPMLLLAIFMLSSYLIYPIEVVSPGWLNFKRLVRLYLPLMGLSGIYFISVWAGVKYSVQHSIPEMLQFAGQFEVLFRLLLFLILFLSSFFIFFIPDAWKTNDVSNAWIRKYSIIISVNILAYVMVLVLNSVIIHTLYYYISVGCSLAIVHMDLFFFRTVMENRETVITEEQSQLNNILNKTAEISASSDRTLAIKTKNEILNEQLDAYMQKTRAWRNPDLSLNTLAAALYTNRTTLAQVIHDNGNINYTLYINRLRIEDFIQLIESNKSANFQDAFYFAGFRSRATALRNFRKITGMIPSEYFRHKNECFDFAEFQSAE
ncbi:MAG TPA: helix-turn-helix domain-containing protein [Lentimicrobium sp.]|nr:helix-turn-helix domain-containing protein [Lentimicrobium sp.]